MTMNKKWLTLLSFFIILAGAFGCSSENLNETSHKEMPEDFNFTISYGVMGKQKIDTFEDLVVKDLVEDGTVEANISFTDQEMNEIHSKMMEFNMMGELDLNKDNSCSSEPEIITVWTIQMEGETKSFNYNSFCDVSNDIERLRKFEHFITGLMEEKDAYKKLPPSNGAYE
ncbi:MAG TPA: hypothetical protein VLQ66_01410 [Paenisporosarcina sp.]|nr:hypothetical protein [Paenisporosarcina sp.]